MSRNEYAAILIGIVVGVALSNILTSVHKLMAARRRVRWHWMAPTIALSAAILTLGAFWHQWVGAQAYAQPRHYFITALPTYASFFLMFLACAATLPDEVPGHGLDLREYYFANIWRVWGFLAAASALGLVALAVAFFQSGRNVAVLRENLFPTAAVCAGGIPAQRHIFADPRGVVATYCRYCQPASLFRTLRTDANRLMRTRPGQSRCRRYCTKGNNLPRSLTSVLPKTLIWGIRWYEGLHAFRVHRDCPSRQTGGDVCRPFPTTISCYSNVFVLPLLPVFTMMPELGFFRIRRHRRR